MGLQFRTCFVSPTCLLDFFESFCIHDLRSCLCKYFMGVGWGELFLFLGKGSHKIAWSYSSVTLCSDKSKDN